jgi:hypothetical protein
MRKITAVLTMLVVLTALAFASYTALTPITLKQNNYAVQAGDLTVTLTAMDASNGNSYVATGTEILIFQNTDTAAHTITINSVADALGRTDTSLTTYSIAASTVAAVQMSSLTGWQSGGLVTMTTSSNLVKVAVLRHS